MALLMVGSVALCEPSLTGLTRIAQACHLPLRPVPHARVRL